MLVDDKTIITIVVMKKIVLIKWYDTFNQSLCDCGQIFCVCKKKMLIVLYLGLCSTSQCLCGLRWRQSSRISHFCSEQSKYKCGYQSTLDYVDGSQGFTLFLFVIIFKKIQINKNTIRLANSSRIVNNI